MAAVSTGEILGVEIERVGKRGLYGGGRGAPMAVVARRMAIRHVVRERMVRSSRVRR